MRFARLPTLGDLAAQLLERDDLLARALGETGFDCAEGSGVGKDLDGLVERFISSIGTSAASGLPVRVTST